jgi:hypothetical protein
MVEKKHGKAGQLISSHARQQTLTIDVPCHQKARLQSACYKICESTCPVSSKRVMIISNDVSGWNTSGDRVPRLLPDSYCPVFDAILNNRDYIKFCLLSNVLFQSWAGTADSVLNIPMSFVLGSNGKNKRQMN